MNQKWRDYLMLILFCVFLLLIATVWSIAYCKPVVSAIAPPLSTHQKQALVVAWQAGYHVGLPLVFTAVVYVESSLCRDVGHHAAKGCAQIQHPAATVAAGFNIPVWRYTGDVDRDVNMALGARYLALCMDRFGWPGGLACYRLGPAGAAALTARERDRLPYTRAVLAAMRWLREVPSSDD